MEFCDAWGGKYPAIVKLWSDAWAEFVPFLAFRRRAPQGHLQHERDRERQRIREAVRARGHFPNETAALKCVYMALMSLDPTGTGRKR